MPVQARIMTRMPSVLDSFSAWHLARNASHSSAPIRPTLRLGVSCSLRSAGGTVAGARTAPSGRFLLAGAASGHQVTKAALVSGADRLVAVWQSPPAGEHSGNIRACTHCPGLSRLVPASPSLSRQTGRAAPSRALACGGRKGPERTLIRGSGRMITHEHTGLGRVTQDGDELALDPIGQDCPVADLRTGGLIDLEGAI
jgi:hypothetical protein